MLVNNDGEVKKSQRNSRAIRECQDFNRKQGVQVLKKPIVFKQTPIKLDQVIRDIKNGLKVGKGF